MSRARRTIAVPAAATASTTQALIDRVMPAAIERGGGNVHMTFALMLALAADELADGQLRHGAAVVAGERRVGAPAINDAAAVAEVRARRAAGERNALAIVARRLAEREGADPKHVARRLRRKLQIGGGQTVPSAPHGVR